MSRRLLIATHNPGKVAEYRSLLFDLPLGVTWLDEVGITEDVEETEDSFQGNAILKARHYAGLTGLWTWADDSGLEIDALDGRPGVYSARYGGKGLTDADRYRKVLAEMIDVPDAQRTARFRCVVAIAQPGGKVDTRDGTLEGVIAREPKGSHGFGYDPIFYIPGFHATLAELERGVKNEMSHRAEAAARAREMLAVMLSEAEGGEE
ncbi:MAG: RdgB/HAM1 family non-canonical purine NTP pyrophosphatase [Chloroflexi bacterium]|nr:MAG: RdgB/HAM1 family non-canonical purine NTP pyrophosphatase [Chloroflexota bacterium]